LCFGAWICRPPVSCSFAEKFKVVAFDINHIRIIELEQGHDRGLEVEDELLKSVKNNITYTSNIIDAKNCYMGIAIYGDRRQYKADFTGWYQKYG
jgi:UDP-N-acetyl-D-mannosaminuronate dehydrogenase